MNRYRGQKQTRLNLGGRQRSNAADGLDLSGSHRRE